MWPFRRKAPEPQAVELTDAAFGRYLRSLLRTDLQWFLSLPDDQQEAMAQMGDDYMRNVGIMLGKCIGDPESAEIEALMAEGDEAAVGARLEQIANLVAQPQQARPRRMRPAGAKP